MAKTREPTHEKIHAVSTMEEETEEAEHKPASTVSVGRIVHYWDGNEPSAAVIFRVQEKTITIALLGTARAPFEAPYSVSPKRGHWNWPPRV